MVEEPSVRRRRDAAASVPFGTFGFIRFCIFGSPRSNFRRHLSCGRTHSTEAHEVVGQGGQAHQLFVAPDPQQSGLAQTADSLAPTKELFDAFTHDLASAIAWRLERAFTQTGGVVSGVDGDMGSDALREQALDESARVITRGGSAC